MEPERTANRRPDLIRIAWATGVAFVVLALCVGGAIWRYLTIVPPYAMPRPPLPSPNAFDYYARAAKMTTAMPATDGSLVSDPKTPPEQLGPLIAPYQGALRVLREGQAHACAVPLPRPLPADLGSAQCGELRNLARLLSADSRARAARGDTAGALRSALDAVHLGTDLGRGGGMSHFGTGRACQAIGLAALVPLGDRLTAKQCRQGIARLEALERRQQPTAEMLRTAYAYQRECLPALLADGGANLRSAGIDYLSTTAIRWRAGPAARELGQFYGEAIRQATLPPARRRPIVPPRHGLVTALFGGANATILRGDVLTARFRLLRTELALRAYRLDHRRPATALADLVPDYLPAVPDDPFDPGRPLGYHAAGPFSYVLPSGRVPAGSRAFAYSIGPDCASQGGQEIVPSIRALDGLSGDLAVLLGVDERDVLATAPPAGGGGPPGGPPPGGGGAPGGGPPRGGPPGGGMGPGAGGPPAGGGGG